MSHTRSQDDVLLQSLAEHLSQPGLRVIALATLEAGRPLALLGAQLLWLAEPALCLFWKREQVAGLARLLERPGTVDVLMQHLNGE